MLRTLQVSSTGHGGITSLLLTLRTAQERSTPLDLRTSYTQLERKTGGRCCRKLEKQTHDWSSVLVALHACFLPFAFSELNSRPYNLWKHFAINKPQWRSRISETCTFERTLLWETFCRYTASCHAEQGPDYANQYIERPTKKKKKNCSKNHQQETRITQSSPLLYDRYQACLRNSRTNETFLRKTAQRGVRFSLSETEHGDVHTSGYWAIRKSRNRTKIETREKK